MNLFRNAGLVPALIATLLVSSVASAQINSANVALDRTITGTVDNGETISVNLTFTAAPPNGRVILGLGLRETLPAGASYKGITTSSGDQPAIKPALNKEGLLEFAWITVPAFPYTISYSVALGEAFASPSSLTGQLEYRTTGGAEFSNVKSTTLEIEDDTPAWKTGLFAGCAPGGADVSSGLADWTLAALVLAALVIGARRTQARLQPQRLRATDRR
jgi:hypothetical protein